MLASASCEDKPKPNFVVILTDDQDVVLGGMVSSGCSNMK